MRVLTATIKTKTGLHARPAALLVNTVAQYKSEVKIAKNGQEANLKSLLDLLSLGAEQGDRITITVDGTDEDEVIAALQRCAMENELW
ncbi:MAG: HPr family phosphocarrier protein [Firmicutes bacterium]|mgnify:CR=1 FL=1|nr:HPr family phosphocarrier protein [Bacillota bacterium]